MIGTVLNPQWRLALYDPHNPHANDCRISIQTLVQEGLDADLVMVDTRGHAPRVIRTFVAGQQVFACR